MSFQGIKHQTRKIDEPCPPGVSLGRAFLIDHMCVLPFGHNLNALVLFKQAIEEFREAICLASRNLPDWVEQADQVEAELYYPYGGFMDTAGDRDKSPTVSPHKFMAFARKFFKRAMFTTCFVFLKFDYARFRTRRDWRRVFRKYVVGPRDLIFFPSSDFYGCISLIDHISRLPREKRPRVHVRMIGVMEGVAYALGSSRPRFISAMKVAKADGIDISLSAETTRYAEYVQRVTGLPVAYLPYPLMSSPAELGWRETKMVASPGQGRADKGFFLIREIIARLHRAKAAESFRFEVQGMRVDDPHYRKRYQDALSRLDHLSVLPALLSQEQIDRIYVSADILLLPYDQETYAWRGSAVYQEGVAFGRPVVCTAGTGVADMVQRYGNGLLASNEREFASQLVELASRPREEIQAMIEAARDAYRSDFVKGLDYALGVGQ